MRLRADQDGRFVWKEAPADTVYCDVDAEGYLRQNRVPLTASDREITVTLQRVLRVHETVVDAETNRPIDVFTVVPGIYWGDRRPVFWERSRARSQTRGGAFDYVETFSRPGFAVRIEAPGYLPAESRIFKQSDGEVAFDFKLTRGSEVSANVLKPDGTPAAGAAVYLVLPGEALQIRDGKTIAGMPPLNAKTGNDGRFSFPPQLGQFLIVILSDDGYGQFDSLPGSGKLQLMAWGRVEGELRIGSRAAAGQKAAVQVVDSGRMAVDKPRVLHLLDTEADANGRFVVGRVPPGKISVARSIWQPTGAGSFLVHYTDSQTFDLEPGQTLHVKIGGGGRTVVGRVRIPQQLAGQQDWNWGMMAQARTKIDRPKLPVPADLKGASAEQRRKW